MCFIQFDVLQPQYYRECDNPLSLLFPHYILPNSHEIPFPSSQIDFLRLPNANRLDKVISFATMVHCIRNFIHPWKLIYVRVYKKKIGP